MKRIFLKLGVSLVTFIIGVSVTGLYSLYAMPDVTLPEVGKVLPCFSGFPGLSLRVVKSTNQTDYFPWSDDFLTDWYSKHLEAMNELPLAALENEDESYRLLWLRTFDQPVAVRVWRTGDRYFIVAKQLNGRGGYEPGTIDLYWAHSLSENDWDAFMMHLEHSNYWSMPTEDDRRMTDGAQWVLEGYREGRYHVVDRQSPDADAYRDACMYLLRQSGLLAEIPTNEVY